MSTEQLCLSLLAAESEAAIQDIVQGDKEMSDPANWNAIDNRETNFNVTSNQASDGGKALTELMTNMVDAVLLKYAHLKGIDPKGSSAPKTMYDAVDQLVKNMHGGKLTNLDPKDSWLQSFAQENLAIGVTGARSKKAGLPCYTFADGGEGQAPDRFPDTFLSLSAGNKKDIDFVQGKYNMGSSGVLGYCGRRGFKLIISRRYDGKHPWGWTLVRRRPAAGMPIFEYFRPHKQIPRFDTQEIFPFRVRSGKLFDGVKREAGTIVKLYDYQIGTEYMGFKGSREALNENLVETILPFRIYDLRQTPDPKRSGSRAIGVDERSFYGMEWLLLNSHSSTVDLAAEESDEDSTDVAEDDNAILSSAEGSVSIAGITHPELGAIRITGVVLRKGPLPQWLKPPKHINRIFHSVHGQVQFKQTRGALSDFGFPALKDRLVVFVDASDLTFAAHNDVWKADREHINKTIVGQMYLDEVKEAIRKSETLRDLQQRIAQEELDSSADEKSVELFQRLVNSDKNLAALLSGTPPRITMPQLGPAGALPGTTINFVGKHSPTFVRFDNRIKAKMVEIPINANYPLSASTDAVNDYFDRSDGPGHLLVSEIAASRFSVHRSLKDGRLTIYLKPISKEVAVGEEIDIRIGLTDPGNAHLDVSDNAFVRIVEAREKPKPTPSPGPIPPSPVAPVDPKKPGGSAESPNLAVPQFQFLTKDGRMIGDQPTVEWEEGTDEKSGGFARDLGGGVMKFFINYDNAFHLSEKKRQKTEVARQAISEKYKWGMLVLMISIEQAYKALPDEEREMMNESIDQVRILGARAAAACVLTIAEILPKILDTSQLDVE